MQLNIDFIFASFNRFYNYKNNETINFLRLLVIKYLNSEKANNKKVVSKLLITLNEYCSIILNSDINITTFNNDIISIILRFNKVQIYQYMRVKYPINTNILEYRKNREFYINDKLNRDDTPIYLFGKRIYP